MQGPLRARPYPLHTHEALGEGFTGGDTAYVKVYIPKEQMAEKKEPSVRKEPSLLEDS